MAEVEEAAKRLDTFIRDTFAPEDDALQAALADMAREGIPDWQVSPSEGKMLQVLARTVGARRILEIGTLGGYSTIWLGRALPPDGALISLELDPHRAAVSRRSVERAGLGAVVEIRVGPASESLATMAAEGEPPFDVVFIDADKDNYPEYLERAVPLTRVGGLILADNTLTHSATDPQADTGVTRYNAAVAARQDLISALFPTLRDGIDGLLVSVKAY